MKTESLYYALCKHTDSPFSLGLNIRLANDPQGFVAASIDPANYNDPATFAADYACYAALRKYRGLNTGIDLGAVATSKFGNSEETCQLTNARLRHGNFFGQDDRVDSSVIARIRQIISSVWASPTFEDLFDRCGWGPGSTSSLRGMSATREDKMSQFPVSVTPAALPYLRQVLKTDILWLRHLLKQDVGGPTTLLDSCFALTSASRLLTVPKDSRTHRTICAEPTANIFLQKGVGGYLRARLKRYGVNLDDQTINQELARRAYAEGLATLDLSSASDHISIAAVKLLCPSEMFELLNCLRAPAYRVRGVETRFHKFSSMGNGFTFELESLIFFAVVKAVADIRNSGKPLGIYGDDIICDASLAEEVIRTLDFLGFPVNKEKSFITGNFFESCGKHYFQGFDVTPFYQKEVVIDPMQYMRQANRFFDWTIRLYLQGLVTADDWRFKIHNRLLREAPERTGDLKGFWWLEGEGFFRTRRDPRLSHKLNEGFLLRFLKPRKPRSFLADGGLYASVMRHASVGKSCIDTVATNGMVTPRSVEDQVKYRVGRRRVQLFGRTAELHDDWRVSAAEV